MSVMTYSNARKNFRAVIDRVNDDAEAVIVTTKDEKNAVIISESDYNAIMETLYLTSNPFNAQHLNESITQLNNGQTVEVEIND